MPFPNPLEGVLDSLSSRDPVLARRPVPARVDRAVTHAVAVEQGRGIVTAARIRSQGYVAQEAMQEVGQLAQLENFWAQHAPQAAGRLQHIADISAIRMAETVSDFGRER